MSVPTQFAKYESMDNIRSKFFGLIVGEVVLIEKVHGSNFQFTKTFYPDGDFDVKIGKDRLSLRCRSQEVLRSLRRQGAIPPKVHLLCSNIHQNLPVSQKEQPVVVTIYGELYGGRYNYVTDGVLCPARSRLLPHNRIHLILTSQ